LRKSFDLLKKRAFRRILIRQNYQRIKLKRSLETIEKIIEEWRNFSKKKASFSRKMQFLNIEGKSQKKKFFFRFWLKKSRNFKALRDLEENIEKISNNKRKKQVFNVWKEEITRKRGIYRKNYEIIAFFQRKKIEEVFRKLRENSFFKSQLKNKTFLLKNRHLAIEKGLIMRKWLEITKSLRKADNYREISLKQRAFSAISCNFLEISSKIKLFLMKTLYNKAFFSMKLYRIHNREARLLRKKSDFLEKSLEKTIKNRVFACFLIDLQRKRLIYQQSKDYFSYHLMRKSLELLKSHFLLRKLDFHREILLRKSRETHMKSIYMKLWAFKLRERKEEISKEKNIIRKRLLLIKNKSFIALKRFYEKKRAFRGKTEEIKRNLLRNKLILWRKTWNYQEKIKNLKEKKDFKAKRFVFLRIYEKYSRNRCKSSIFQAFSMKKLDFCFKTLKSYFLSRKSQMKTLQNIKKTLFLKKKLMIFRKLLCFSLIKRKRREIIKILENKRLEVISRLFLDELKNLDKFRELKREMLEKFLYKSGLKLCNRILEELRIFGLKNKGKRLYHEKIRDFMGIKRKSRVFEKIKRYGEINRVFQGKMKEFSEKMIEKSRKTMISGYFYIIL